MTPTLCKAGSWPVEGFDKRNHCIRFYARFRIQLKLSSHLSFIEQVVQCEHYIASGQRKVMTVGLQFVRIKSTSEDVRSGVFIVE
jgi:hypothetical protein